VDLGSVVTDSLIAIVSERPAHTRGRCDCCHAAIEVAFLRAGATHATIGGRSSVLRPGQYWVISGDVEHTTRTAEEGSRGTYLQLRPSFIDGIADELGVAPWARRHTAATAITPALHGALVALEAELTSERPAQLLVESVAQYLTGVLLRHVARGAPPTAIRVEPHARRVVRAVDLMHAMPAYPHSLEELASAAGLSKFRFAHLFKAHYGVSPHRYLVNLRTRLGAERLRQSDLSVARVALDLGFASGSRFAREIARQYGVSPSAYRASEGSKI
jgi:AraC-like DNA-binding protein